MADPDQIVTDPNILKLFNDVPKRSDVVTDPSILQLFQPKPPLPKSSASDNIVGAEGTNPDEMAKAQEIGRQLDIAPAAVQTDLPGYTADAQRNAAIAEAEKSPILKDWLARHPDNAKVASDDLPALNRVISAASKLSSSRSSDTILLKKIGDSAFKGGVEAAKAGWGDEPIAVSGTPEFMQWGRDVGLWGGNHPYVDMGVFNYIAVGAAFDAASLAIKTGRAALYGVFGSLRGAVDPLPIPNDVKGILSGEWIHVGGFGGVGHYAPIPPRVMTSAQVGYINNKLRSFWNPARPLEGEILPPEAQAGPRPALTGPSIIDAGPAEEWKPNYPNEAAAEPYAPSANRSTMEHIENGEPPRVGDSYVSDQVHIEQSAADSALLQRSFEAAQEAKLKERSPQALEDLLSKTVGSRLVHIPAEVVEQLYRGNDPHAQDKILGWADNIEQKVATSQSLGTDLQVPLAQFLANVDPSVYANIKDKIRLQETGVSPEEAKVLKDKDPEEYPVETQAPKDSVSEMYERHPEMFAMRRRRRGRGEPLGSATEKIIEAISKKIDEEKAERVIAPAVRIRGKVYTGAFHPDAFTAAAKELGVSEEDLAKEVGKEKDEFQGEPAYIGGQSDVDGFVTSKGRYVNRQEALKIAKAQDQVEPHLGEGEGLAADALKPMEDEDFETLRKMQEAPTDISSAMRIPRVPELPRPPEVPRLPAPPAAPAIPLPPPPPSLDNLGEVTTKTLVDKAVKAVTSVTAAEYKPDIALTIDKNTRTIAVHDNGSGMSPDALADWLKAKNIDEELAFHHNTAMRVYTLENGQFSTVKSDGQSVRVANRTGQPLEPTVRPEMLDDRKMFPDGHGTRVEVDVPNEYLHPGEGTLEPIELSDQAGDHAGVVRAAQNNPNVNVTFNGQKAAEALLQEQIATEPIEPETPLSRAVKREQKALYLAPLFDPAKAAGMDQVRFRQYSKKIEAADAETNAKALKRAADLVKKRLTSEWKADRNRVKAEVTTDYNSHPTIAAERYLRLGELPSGERVARIKLDEQAVKELGGKDLERYTVKKNGVHPDEVAPTVQASSGKELVDMLNNFEIQRAQFGKSPREYVNHLIEMETNLRMEQQFGDLKENILEEARDLVTFATHLDILTDEMKILADMAGLPFEKADIPSLMKEAFRGHVAAETTYEKFRKAAEKNALEAEKALLKGDHRAAFQAKLRQYQNVLQAKEARVFEKKVRTAEKNWKSIMADRSRKGIAQEYFDNVRKLINDTGFKQVDNLQVPKVDLETLVAESSGQVAVAPWMVPSVDRSISYDKMTVGQVEAMINSVRSIMHVGAEARKIDSMHGAADMDNFLVDLENQLKRFGVKLSKENQSFIRRQVGGRFINIAAKHVLVERLLDYTDKFDPQGPLTRFLDRPLRESFNKRLELQEQVVKRLRELEKYVGNYVMDQIDNKHIIDPNDMLPVPMNRHNLRHIMLWLGSDEGIDKVTNAYGIDMIQAFDLVRKNARAEDFHWVNGMHELFKYLWSEAAPMIERYTGVMPEGRAPRAWKMKLHDGQVMESTGGYAPIFHDKGRSNITGDLSMKNELINAQWTMKGTLFDSNYTSAIPAHGYTMPLTKYKGWPDFNGTMMTSKIAQMIHDIAFRESVRNAQKIIGDARFITLLRRHWGPEYADLMDGWIRDIANEHAKDDSYAQGLALGLSYLRKGMINTLIGGNTDTAMKHGSTAMAMSVSQVGAKEMVKGVVQLGLSSMVKALKQLVSKNRDFLTPEERANVLALLKDTNTLDFINNSSVLMRNRSLPYANTLRGAYERATDVGFFQRTKQVASFSSQLGRVLVALADYVSANPLWLSTYKRAMMASGDHVDAVFEADRAVTRAHGSNFPGDKPEILRLPNTGLGEFGKMFMALAGFWNHMTNNWLQWMWDVYARSTRGAGAEPGANIPNLALRVFLLAIIPLLAEEEALPALTHDEKGGNLKKWTFAGLRFLGSMSPFTRDGTNAILNGREPSVGMLGAFYHLMVDMTQDVAKWTKGKPGRDWIKHMIAAMGILGVPAANQSSGALVQGLIKQARGQERPRQRSGDYTAQEWRALYRLGHIPRHGR